MSSLWTRIQCEYNFHDKILNLGDLYAFLNDIQLYIKSPMQKAPSYIFDWVLETPLILTNKIVRNQIDFILICLIWVIANAWKLAVYGVILVRIFLQSVWIRIDTSYLTVFSPNMGKCEPEQLRLFTQSTRYKKI